ncbi:MAG: hydroxyacylglutathione hydrolase [Betaproteobacteria bacterium]|nr:hydroxyacylglutathione hydrolase [Betaproteobacteria bacterium]
MLQLESIAILSDNYVWVLHDQQSCLVVDPGVAAPILAWMTERRLQLAGILITHHHADHCGGLADLPAVPTYGPAHPALPARVRPVSDKQSLTFPALDLKIEVIATPGHTLSHLCFYIQDLLFCGDTLFSCGCGRLFEGTPAQMLASLERLSALPDATRVCPAHEYTLANLAFARDLEPEHQALLEWENEARALRRRGQPTLPVRLGDEKRRNPFLRCHEPGLQTLLGCTDTLSAFTHLRAQKDVY